MALFGGKKDKEKEPEESKESFDLSSDRGRLDYFNVASRPVKDAFIKRHPALGKDDLYKHAMFNYAQEDVTGKFMLDLTGYTSKESIDSLIGRINTQMESSRINLETTDLKSPAFEKELRSFNFIANSDAVKKTEAIIGTSMSTLYESIKEMELDGTKPSELEGKLKDHSLTDLNKTFYSTILHALTEKGFDRKDLDMQKTLLETKVETIFEKAPVESTEKKPQETTAETKPTETPIAKVNEVKPVEAATPPAPAPSEVKQETPTAVNEVKPVETPPAAPTPAATTPSPVAEMNKTEVTPPKAETTAPEAAQSQVSTPAAISTPATIETPPQATPPTTSSPAEINSTAATGGTRDDKQIGGTASFLQDLGIPIETLNAIGFASTSPAESQGKVETPIPGGSGVKESMKSVSAPAPQVTKNQTPVVQSVAPEITKEVTPIAVAENKQEPTKKTEEPSVTETTMGPVPETPMASEVSSTSEAPAKTEESKADNASGADMSEVAALLKKLIKVMEGPLLVTDTKNKY